MVPEFFVFKQSLYRMDTNNDADHHADANDNADANDHLNPDVDVDADCDANSVGMLSASRRGMLAK
jgi:hypothetical protein